MNRRTRRDLSVLARNAGRLLLLGGARDWWRNRSTALPAISTMTVLLALAGLVLLGGQAVRNAAATESHKAAVLEVYLKDGVADADLAALQRRLSADPRVASVRYVSRDEALQRARHRPGLADLSSFAGANPFPAGLDVQVRSLGEVAGVAASAAHDPAVDPTGPTSYDTDTYAALQGFLYRAGVMAVAILVVFLAVAAVVTANSMRAASLARRSEIRVMHLVGAAGWVVRIPLMVEGALTGATAGILAAVTLGFAAAAALRASHSMFVELLPGIGWAAVASVCLLLVLAGAATASLASLAAVRGMRA